MAGAWTLRRATLVGSLAGLAALLLWPAHAILGTALRWPFVVALALTAVSGLSVLAFILIDMATVRRSRHARPARMFDVALGLALLVPAAAMLREMLG